MSRIRELTAAGAPALGAFQLTSSRILAEGMAKARFDWLCVDLQHGEVDWSDLIGIIQAMQLGDCDVLVRVPWNDPAQIMRVLDCGASGVIVPMVSTAEDAARAVAATRYSPRGIRSVGQTRKMYDTPVSQYTSETEEDPICLVMIETAEGLENMAAIAATPGLDGIFLGTGDLAVSLGLAVSVPPHATIAEAITRMIILCRQEGVLSATIAGVGGEFRTLVESGLQVITMGTDLGYASKATYASLREANSVVESLRKT